jgi:Protein of unknown function (DUF2971)
VASVAPQKIQEPGPWLSHYTTAATAFERILPDGELRMSPYRLMRDPAENQDLFPGTAFFGGRPDAERARGETVQSIREARDQIRLLCLTRDTTSYEGRDSVFGCCWARARLWEQYAESHRGVCLVFDRAQLEQTLNAELSQQGAVYLGEVEYTPAGPAVRAASIVDERIFDRATRPEAVLDFIRNLFFLKAEDWATEYELRTATSRRREGVRVW